MTIFNGIFKNRFKIIKTNEIDSRDASEITLKKNMLISAGSTGGLKIGISEAIVSITAVHTCTIQVNIPSGAKLLNVQLRVDSALAALETWNAQYVTGATQSIGTAQTVAQNTKLNKFFDENAATAITSAETDITIQRSSNPGVDVFTAQGSIRAIAYYQEHANMVNV